MEISSERLRIVLQQTDYFDNMFRIKVYPKGEYMVKSKDDVEDFGLSVDDVKTDVDIFSILGEIVDSVATSDRKKPIPLCSLFDSNSKFAVDYCNPILQYSFIYNDLMKAGKLEKKILEFDLYYNGKVHAISLLTIEALYLTKKCFDWMDLWGKN